MKLIKEIIVCGALLAGGFNADAGEDYSQWLGEFFEDVQEYQQSQNPVWAAREGDDSAKGKLRDVSPEAYQKRKKQYLAFIKELKSIHRDELSADEQISYDMMMAQLKQSVAEIDFKTYEMPLTSEYGFHAQTTNLANAFRFRTAQDYKDYIALLGAIPTFFEQNVSNMRAGMERNFTVPRAVLDGYSDGIKVYIKENAEDTVWYRPFTSMPDTISQEDRVNLQNEAETVINQKVVPQYQAYLEFFENEYLPAAKKTIAATDYPDGKAFYQNQIKLYTTLDLTPDEIHEIGLKEVARIRREMEEVIETTGFEGTFEEFLHFLRTDEQFYAQTPEELLKEASYMAKKMDHQLPKFFGKLPRQPYGVVPVPEEIAPKYTTGRYSGAPIDSARAGEYWVNTYALDKRPLYNLEALTLHEAVPGHHLQTALAQELTDLPKFRQNTYISAFGEGWGLYSEKLGLEAGFYKDPYSNFGRLTYEMWRAMRLVVDTGMHAKGWSREKAIQMMENNTALSTLNVRTEIDRYISWPAQALSYKLGELKILELRARAEKELGEGFDIRKFHDAVLANGSIPLSVLEEQINAFINDQKIEQKDNS
ncbi:DUF885 domain-containing protein [Kangiella sediminilitoris]|uniref:DUF885 domain-containing protein n=1 Tax=Kangiella sediminilitoris TaxID=1144748 RepID=A0A1B3BBU9_9GAMM|nr:DUF885 domain-containing protein [Kangiella sediminilitoris]AOE50274.1 hypothetical protein KS2013_1564 [Kangiella sediminilitoris]